MRLLERSVPHLRLSSELRAVTIAVWVEHADRMLEP